MMTMTAPGGAPDRALLPATPQSSQENSNPKATCGKATMATPPPATKTAFDIGSPTRQERRAPAKHGKSARGQTSLWPKKGPAVMVIISGAPKANRHDGEKTRDHGHRGRNDTPAAATAIVRGANHDRPIVGHASCKLDHCLLFPLLKATAPLHESRNEIGEAGVRGH